MAYVVQRGHRAFVKDQHSILTVQTVPRQTALPRNIDTGNLIFINCTSRSKSVTKQNKTVGILELTHTCHPLFTDE